MHRSFGIDVLECPRHRGRFRLIAVIEDPAVVTRLVRHLGLSTQIPEARAHRQLFSPDSVAAHRSRSPPSTAARVGEGRTASRARAGCLIAYSTKAEEWARTSEEPAAVAS